MIDRSRSAVWALPVAAAILLGLVSCSRSSPPPRLTPDTAKAARRSPVESLDTRDSLEDGTPDFLRLDNPQDRDAFRRWFTWLAEAQYFQDPKQRPVEISDCAGLLRYAYRESLRAHGADWALTARVPVVPPFEAVAKYQYPQTPLGAALFRVRDGSFRAADLSDGAFAQFADAKTLWRLNCHRVNRRLAAAQPGDLLFFRREGDVETFHSMIYLGTSHFTPGPARYLLYHTGPNAEGPGEMRRFTVEEMLRFPRAEWRPLESNGNFLGVYRWNILCPAGTE